MISIITGTTNKPVASEALRNIFQTNDSFSGLLYIGYPIIGTAEGAFPIDALWISQEKGIVAFNLIEGKDISEYEEKQDDCANKIEAKLKGFRQLVEKRVLCVDVNVITFAPALLHLPEVDADYPLCNDEDSLKNIIKDYSWEKPQYYEKTVSVIQAISTIRKGKKKRAIADLKSRGAKLQSLEESIANLDNHQSRAVIETVDGVQRIRGLAGSGKTIVLALKAAYLHAKHPEWKIAVTFNTRSLKGQLRQLINTFYIEQTSDEPDWESISIIHAWGAPGGGERNGIYYTFCSTNNVNYYDYLGASQKFGRDDSFGHACESAISEAKTIRQIYDAILVDEAQDFSPSFLRLCYEMLREPKRLVYAYDELQNLSSQSLPSPEHIFGNLPDGTPKVKFYQPAEGKPQQDIILEKCYRNSRPALVTAHALGFGIYRKQETTRGTGLVQMFEQSNLWIDIGYEVTDGSLRDGEHVVLQRTNKSSPVFLENHSEVDDLIMFKSFSTKSEQDSWVAEQIKINLEKDELRPDDIIVINPNPLTTKKNVSGIRTILFENNINSHTCGVDTTPDVFFTEDNDSIAFTGIYRAKGNEAAMVYIINTQDCYDSSYDLAKLRNMLFTAITRSKAWVRVLGVGPAMDELIKEYEEVKKHSYTLDFIYPTKTQRDHMRIVNRDMTELDKRRVSKTRGGVADLISELESGQIYLEDLGDEQVRKLRALLNQGGE